MAQTTQVGHQSALQVQSIKRAQRTRLIHLPGVELTSEMITYELARPKHAVSLAKLYNEVYDGHYSLTAFMDPVKVEQLIRSEKYYWCIALFGDVVVGSAALDLNMQQRNASLGKTVVASEFTGRGIAATLMRKLQQEGSRRNIHILHTCIRNGAMYSICERKLSQQVVGYLPGAHLVREREVHLLSMELSEQAKHLRVSAHNNFLYGLPGVQLILSDFGLEPCPGAYPEEVLVAHQASQEQQVVGTFNTRENSIQLTSFPQGMVSLPQYFEAMVLADKVETMEALQSMGFSMSAFLPGWYYANGLRYDCVLFTLSLQSLLQIDKSFDLIIERLRRGFSFGGDMP